MKLNTIIYTTYKEDWFSKDFEYIDSIIDRAEGIEPGKYTTAHLVELPQNPPIITDRFGVRTFDWEWFTKEFPAPPDYNAVAFLFDPKWRDDLGLSKKYNGYYNDDSDEIFHFWLTPSKGMSQDYKNITEFSRIYLHELSHGFARWLHGAGKDYTHVWDYTLKDIQGAFYTYSFNLWNEKYTLLQSLKAQLQKLKETLMGTEYTSFPIDADAFLNNVSQKFANPDPRYMSGVHPGTDWSAPVGTEIYAPCDGFVSKSVKGHKDMGNMCYYTFQFRGEWYTARFMHLQYGVPELSYKKGEVLALSGNTGRTTGPHVHIDMQKGQKFNIWNLYTKKSVLINCIDPWQFFFDNREIT